MWGNQERKNCLSSGVYEEPQQYATHGPVPAAVVYKTVAICFNTLVPTQPVQEDSFMGF